MKALLKKASSPGLWLEEVPIPTIGINDVLIKVKKTAICGTDMHIFNWDKWAKDMISIPMVVGHEFVGEIVEIGSNVNDFSYPVVPKNQARIRIQMSAALTQEDLDYALNAFSRVKEKPHL